QFQWLLLLSA
ncbi:hypothetical protein D043_4137B, partial [Vibrio parahaemolyticus EKP-021]